jgi:hypothetical protein
VKRALLALVLVAAGCGVQPTGPIPGSNATGLLIYLVKPFDNTLTPALYPYKYATEINAALNVLANIRDQPGPGVRNEVPHDAAPMRANANGSTVSVAMDVNQLSALAALQIVCTASSPGPVTLVGNNGQTRGPLLCPVQ